MSLISFLHVRILLIEAYRQEFSPRVRKEEAKWATCGQTDRHYWIMQFGLSNLLNYFIESVSAAQQAGPVADGFCQDCIPSQAGGAHLSEL